MIDRFFANPKARLGAGILVLLWLVALVGPWVVGDPAAFVDRPHEPPSAAHLLGTTGQGQDVLAQTIVGARSTLAVGFIVGLSVTAIGALVGGTAGYYGGRLDEVLSTAMQVFLLLPGLPLAVVLASVMSGGVTAITVVLIITGWAWNARLVRGQTLALSKRDFIAAAVVSGESHVGVIVREILPNLLPLLASCFIGATTYAIAAAVGLEFLGLGDLGAITWGTNLYWASNDAALLTGSWWTFVPTGIGIALVGFALVLCNFAVDEVANPRLFARRAWLAALRGSRSAYEGATPVVKEAL